MLNNPDWDKDKLTLTALIEWLETHDPEERYNYSNVREPCLAHQYNISIGRKYNVGTAVHDDFDGRLERIASLAPRTFGGALQRAKAMRKEKEGA